MEQGVRPNVYFHHAESESVWMIFSATQIQIDAEWYKNDDGSIEEIDRGMYVMLRARYS